MANDLTLSSEGGKREAYQRRMLEIADAFKAGATGAETLLARSTAIDALITSLWSEASAVEPLLSRSAALVALGGYGRHELFPYSDVDLLFLIDSKIPSHVFESAVKKSIRSISQALWDSGLRVSPLTRRLNECDRFDAGNAEFGVALLDQRFLCGNIVLHGRLENQILPKMLDRDRAAMLKRLVEITRTRHARYGSTLFHLEPNIKDGPGGLRDANVCGWIEALLARERVGTTLEAGQLSDAD